MRLVLGKTEKECVNALRMR